MSTISVYLETAIPGVESCSLQIEEKGEQLAVEFDDWHEMRLLASVINRYADHWEANAPKEEEEVFE